MKLKIPGGKKVLVGAGAAVLLAAAVFVIPRFVNVPVQINIGTAAASGNPQALPPTPTPTPGHQDTPVGLMYTTKERVLNLADPGGYRYLKIQVVLEFGLPEKEAKSLKGEAFKKKLDDFNKELSERRGPIIDDIIGTVLGSKTSAALSTVEGKDAVKRELQKRLNEVTGENEIVNVYFTQFLVQ